MKKTYVYAVVAVGFAILLVVMLRRSSEPNIPLSDPLEPAEDSVEGEMPTQGSSRDFTSSSAERVEAMEPTSEGGMDDPNPGNVVPLDGGEALADSQETNLAGINDINLTEALSNDHLVQKVAEIRSVHCEGRTCLILAQVKNGEEEHATAAFSQFLATHPEYGLRSEAAPDKDDNHLVSVTFFAE